MGGILEQIKQSSYHQKDFTNQNQCLLCHCTFSNKMNSVPIFFIPAAHILYACADVAHKNMYFPSLKFFIAPIWAMFAVRGNGPVCPACRRLAVLWSIVIYLLLFVPLFTVLFLEDSNV